MIYNHNPIEIDGEEFKWYSSSNSLDKIFDDAKILVEMGIDIYIRKQWDGEKYTGAYELFVGG